MMHFVNSVCACVLVYATVTRGGLGFARVLELAAARIRS
jgi:hypothetical protein